MERHTDLVKADRYSDEAQQIEDSIVDHKCMGDGCDYCIKHQKAYSMWQRAYDAIKRYNRKVLNSPFFREEASYRKQAKYHSDSVNESCLSQVDDDDY